MRIVWTPASVNDLKDISHQIERDRSLDTANRVCRAIYDNIQILCQHPLSGRVGVENGTRELVVSKLPYIVAYRLVDPASVQILHIWHGAQFRS